MKKIALFLFIMLLCANTALYAQTQKIQPAPQGAKITAKQNAGLSVNELKRIITMAYTDAVVHEQSYELCNGGLNGLYKYLASIKIKIKDKKYVSKDCDEKTALNSFSEIYVNTLKKYPKASEEKASYETARGILNKLNDPYAAFFDPKEYKSLMEQMSGGNFGGIGVYIELDNKKKVIRIMSPMEDMPAYRAGLKKGDEIIAINKKPLKDMPSMNGAQDLLRGAPGSKINLTINRAGRVPFDVDLTREMIVVKTVSTKMYENNIGYMRVSMFGEHTGQEVRNALDQLERDGAIAYIMDLRGNTGGYVNAAIHVASEFLPTGTNIVTQIRQQHKNNTQYLSLPNTRFPAPLFILIDKGSASSSEITSGALKDYKVALLIGTVSYGKGRIQKVYPLPNATGMKFTTSYYLTPYGHSIDKKGISPNIVLKKSDNKPVLNEKDDVVLKEAIKRAGIAVKTLNDKKTGDSITTAIPLKSYIAAVNRIKQLLGEDAKIDSSEMVLQNNHLYEKIQASNGEGEHTLWFDRGNYRQEVKPAIEIKLNSKK